MLPKAHVLFACLMVLPSHLLLMMGVYFRNESICECTRGESRVCGSTEICVFATFVYLNSSIQTLKNLSWFYGKHK